MKCTAENISQINFRDSGKSNWHSFYLAHILCSYTYQYEWDDALDGFWDRDGDGCWSDTGSETVPGQIFTCINFRSLGFICEYSPNLYTAKIGTWSGGGGVGQSQQVTWTEASFHTLAGKGMQL